MTALATLDEVKARYDETLGPDDERLVQGSLDSLSIQARFYSGQDWPAQEDCPPRVWDMILNATVRHLRNPDGASQTRAGDETLMWDNRKNELAGTAYFVDREIAELRQMGAGSAKAFGTIATWSWTTGSGRRDLTIGTTPGHGDPLPFIAKEDEVYW